MPARLSAAALTFLLATLATGGCGPSGEAGSAGGLAATTGKAANDVAAGRSPGKPTAPVTLEYDLIGSAIVGQPVGVNLRVTADEPGMPVTLHYRIVDGASLQFAESQPQRVQMTIGADENPRLVQVNVIPQREGRVYLNVSAEVETGNGAMFRAMAIPIQVGATRSAPEVNGELEETARGETVISMPAEEGTDPP